MDVTVGEKLVRDRIPELIGARGGQPVVRTASAEEHLELLRAKLREEVDEFLASANDPEELADVLEVVYALADRLGIGQSGVERLRADKSARRGAFTAMLVLSIQAPE